MWYVWFTLILVSGALGAEDVTEVTEVTEVTGVTQATEATGATGATEATTEAPTPVATTRAPLRTLDRQAAELAWRSWLQSPESGNQNAPPRRITTKSLFITPLVCPKGQRLDRNGCIQVVTVNKDEHERILLEQLNALFTSPPSGDVVYDYGDEDPGPLQLTIPIGLDPLAAPLQAHEPAAEAQEQQPNYVQVNKKDEDQINNDASIEAELELLKLQHSKNPNNDTASPGSGILNHNVLNNFLPFPDKPKRDSPVVNETETPPNNATDQGQKEQFYGHVNVDPVVYGTEFQNPQYDDLPKGTEVTTEQTSESPPVQFNSSLVNNTVVEKSEKIDNSSTVINKTDTETSTEKPIDIQLHLNEHLIKNRDQTKLNPESEYSDIGEAIKLISRYAEVTTDDNFTKDQKKNALKDDNVLGTRTKLQHRRNKPLDRVQPLAQLHVLPEEHQEKLPPTNFMPNNDGYYRYPWSSQHPVTPPPDYPFRHLQDYWPDRSQIRGVYNGVNHENPRRHHHSYPHNYFRPHGLPAANRAGQYLRPQDTYAGQSQGYQYRTAAHYGNPMRSHNQDLYTLLGLRHWFSSESTSKR